MAARVLVVVASRRGSTEQIAQAVAEVLRARGAHVDVSDPEGAPAVAGYDAVVVGSAVYTGHWLPAARAFVALRASELATRPSWFFSSGLAAQPAKAANAPHELAAMAQSVGALGHRSFRGRLDLAELSLAERAVIAAARARQGDHRDFAAIERWAEEVADELERAALVG